MFFSLDEAARKPFWGDNLFRMDSTKLLHRIFQFATVACLLLAIGLTWACLAFKRNTQQFLTTAVTADATVTADIVKAGGDDTPMHYPQFSYQTPDGTTHVLTSNSGSSPPSYTVGQHTQILYPPTNPDGARLNSFWDLWMAPMVFGIMAGACWIGAIFWFIVNRAFVVPKLRTQTTPPPPA